MRNIKINKHRWCALVGAVLFSAVAGAMPLQQDVKINIDRALNKPTLTIRYSGARAATAELRVNGVSASTSTLSGDKTSGEANFQLDLASLKEGENEIEVVLYDKEGHRLGAQKTTITAEAGMPAPVYIVTPKIGSEIRGSVDIQVGFGQSMKNVYVSFFVDSEFKSVRNFPPYSYVWDTTRMANGWHELEAWVVDESSNTYKSRKIRVFVNNPSGNTERPATPITMPSTTNTTKPAVTAKPVVTPKPALTTVPNSVKPSIAGSNGAKATATPAPTTMGPKVLTPTGKRTAIEKPAVTVPATKLNPPSEKPTVVPATTEPKGMISVTNGTRIPKAGKFAIVLDGKWINFDVQPRIENGIPLTPFRYLFEGFGGTVDWDNNAKEVNAQGKDKSVWLKIGDPSAKVNGLPVTLEVAPFLEKGRTILPLSFFRDTLAVEVDYDPSTGHVLISSIKK